MFNLRFERASHLHLLSSSRVLVIEQSKLVVANVQDQRDEEIKGSEYDTECQMFVTENYVIQSLRKESEHSVRIF